MSEGMLTNTSPWGASSLRVSKAWEGWHGRFLRAEGAPCPPGHLVMRMHPHCYLTHLDQSSRMMWCTSMWVPVHTWRETVHRGSGDGVGS